MRNKKLQRQNVNPYVSRNRHARLNDGYKWLTGKITEVQSSNRRMVTMSVRALILLITCLTSYSCRHEDSSDLELYGQENSIWSESIYLRGYRPFDGEKLTDEHIKDFAKTLKANHIKYAYLFAGPFGPDGHLPDYPFSETAIRSVELLKTYYPELKILPWIGGIQNKTVYLNDSIWVENALMDTKRLIHTLNVYGVHIDFEYILSGDPFLDKTITRELPNDRKKYGVNVNNFHRKLKQLVPESFISSVVVATSPDAKFWKRQTTMDELMELVEYVDQLSFLYYDTSISSQQVFEDNCYRLLLDIRTLKESRDIQYLVGIGTFVNEPQLRKYRNLQVESISNTLSTLKTQILRVDPNTRVVDGISIYSDWVTDENEWKTFYQYWYKD